MVRISGIAPKDENRFKLHSRIEQLTIKGRAVER
jgi:hypothetical protein